MWIPIILSLIGLIAIFLEFFLPGALFALIGGGLVIAGVSLFWKLDVPIYYKILYFTISMLTTGLFCKLALWMIKSKARFNLSLEGNQAGYLASELDRNFFGLIGEAQTDLKPSGHIVLNGKAYQAVSERAYISKGKKIEIITGRGAYYVVREKNE